MSCSFFSLPFLPKLLILLWLSIYYTIEHELHIQSFRIEATKAFNLVIASSTNIEKRRTFLYAKYCLLSKKMPWLEENHLWCRLIFLIIINISLTLWNCYIRQRPNKILKLPLVLEYEYRCVLWWIGHTAKALFPLHCAFWDASALFSTNRLFRELITGHWPVVSIENCVSSFVFSVTLLAFERKNLAKNNKSHTHFI